MGKQSGINSMEMAQQLESLKHSMPLIIENLAMNANLTFRYFGQLKKEGFSDEQAMEIIKARGVYNP